MEKGSLDYSDDEKNQIFQDIFSGKIDLENLPEDLYHDIASILKDGVKSGYADAGTKIDFDISDTELIADLQENIYMFSGAKTFTQVKEMMAELVDEKGQIVPFNDFRESARGIFDMFNETYLKTEYDTTIGMAQNAAKWNEIDKQKDLLPYLKYSAVEDANTSEICAPLDGICLPVDDPFWDTYMPLNHFNCRCLVTQEDESAAPDLSSEIQVEAATGNAKEDMQAVFKMNPGKDRVIFDDKHPYFDVGNGYKAFAKENFGLPLPDSE
jgi:SPP1 gp7 family putative phage head morphogenesis protein